MPREPTWHHFIGPLWDASDVRVGDILVCKGTVASSFDNSGPSYVLRGQPALVISVEIKENCAKINVLTRHGVLRLFQQATNTEQRWLDKIKCLIR